MKNIKSLKRLPLYCLILVVAVIQTYPILWIFLSSIKPSQEHLMNPPYALPTAPTLANYVSLLDSMIPTYFKNSVVVAAITLTGIVVLGALAAYPLSKMQFRGRTLVRNFFMLGIMIPIFVSLVPMFGVYNRLGLKNTYWSLIIPQVGFAIPMAMYLYIGFLDQIPDALIEAAYMDGAGSFRIFLEIIVPLLHNAIATIAIFEFVFVWNEFTFANTFISTSAMKTVPVGLNDFINNFGLRDWGLTFAAVSVTVLPTLIVFFILNKQVMAGMTAGAVKS
ncbi:carbohydrate ABC transporter permease [Lachnoclostridium pacaense]|uniref:carbohydrate ABC transporter permease n=1 Tax=Enterocloster hominis (ex Hitch et al. 2024) TaxID=1917870 RepID=UPI001D10D2EF|nr:carbohydrate ABC transporter permease [Lachnoclostridium pacaense]MCC2819479.1 carbohydrate ABC transporter permease [Lachnoclostridium pacaense]